MNLLKAELLIKTGKVDHADWNYRPFLGSIQRLRFGMIKSLLNGVQCHRILEVGYGSGIFMPELDQYCKELYGLDIHNKSEQVKEVLEQVGIKATLSSGSIEKTAYQSDYFDYIVVISALEFVGDIDAACQELQRILKPNGFLVTVTPGHSKILDIGLKTLTGESAKKDYGDRRESLIPALKKGFDIDQSILKPPIIGHLVPLYMGLKLSPK